MLQSGQLDPALAQKLLGQNKGSVENRADKAPSRKRNRSDSDSDEDEGMKSVDELLHDAKKAKNEPLLYIASGWFCFWIIIAL